MTSCFLCSSWDLKNEVIPQLYSQVYQYLKANHLKFAESVRPNGKSDTVHILIFSKNFIGPLDIEKNMSDELKGNNFIHSRL